MEKWIKQSLTWLAEYPSAIMVFKKSLSFSYESVVQTSNRSSSHFSGTTPEILRNMNKFVVNTGLFNNAFVKPQNGGRL